MAQREFRSIERDELEAILAEHEKWLASDGTEGRQADLSLKDLCELASVLRTRVLKGANLREANLEDADLQNAKLEEADLEGASLKGADLPVANLYEAKLEGAHLHGAKLLGTHLYGANLQGADLSQATIQKADLTDADFRGANLKGAKLDGVEKYSGIKLGGADLDGATLPEELAKFEALKNVEEASRNSKKTLTWILLGCVYAWLTVGTTQDAHLLGSSASSKLPIIDASIPAVGFYLAMPLLLVCLYIYFHLNLQRLWHFHAALPAVFPDGTPLDDRAYPWLLTGLVRSYVPRLSEKRTPLSRLRTILSAILGWWLVPATLIALWARYQPRVHWMGIVDWGSWITVVLYGLLLLLTVFCGIRFYQMAKNILRGVDWEPISFKKDGTTQNPYKLLYARNRIGIAVAGIVLVVAVAGINFWAKISPANLKDADLQKEDLRGANLAKANLFRANLAGADLRGATLFRGNLTSANLTGANLTEADLRNAILTRVNPLVAGQKDVVRPGIILTRAKLQWADLSEANLERAKLREAKLEGAKLGFSNLEGADLRGANLREANLFRANLRRANLGGARGLTPDQVKKAVGWQLAFYDEAFLRNNFEVLKLDPETHDEMVQRMLERAEKR